MDATTLPTLLLGGDPQGDPHDTYASWGASLDLPAVRGLVVGRALLYPPDGDVAAAVDIAAELVHGATPMSSRWVLPLGSAEREDWAVVVDESVDGWQLHRPVCGVAAARGGARTLDRRAGAHRRAALGFGRRPVHRLDRRDVTSPARRPVSVFAGPTDVAFVPRDSDLVLEATEPCRVALAVAVVPDQPLGRVPAFRHLAAADVPVELRGAGQASREVRNFGVPGVLDADSIIACEVITPAGNWSSYPPHKHDEDREGVETAARGDLLPRGPGRRADAPRGRRPGRLPAGLRHRERPIDVLAEVRTGDVVLVPHGWHGPAMAAPGYDLYYLNVMAGPGRRAGLADLRRPGPRLGPRHLDAQAVDPRLPLGGAR